MKQPFQTIAEITKIETMAKGFKVVILTNDLSPEEAAKIMSYRDEQGWFLFKPADPKGFALDEIQDLPDVKVDVGEKHPSVRLRNVIYRLWEQVDPGKKVTFENYYRSYMERVIDNIKDKLNP